jgi:hypothetical protein
MLRLAAAPLLCAVCAASKFPAGVHAFFYLWYGNPETDGAYKHWNHELLPHWNEHTRKQYPTDVRFQPPSNIHAPFYPQRGPYSSASRDTLQAQFEEMKSASIEVAAVSWWGRPDQPGTTDTQGVSTDAMIPTVLAAAETAGIKVSFHLEPYHGRTAKTIRLDLAHIQNKYGASPALCRHEGRLLYYVYDRLSNCMPRFTCSCCVLICVIVVPSAVITSQQRIGQIFSAQMAHRRCEGQPWTACF